MNIIKDLIKFEYIYIYNSNINKSIYDDIEENENKEIFLKIFKILEENNKKIFKSNYKKNIKNINDWFKIDFSIFNDIKKTDDILIAYLSIFILISFNLDSNKMLSDDSFKINNISDCCNKVEYLFTKFKIFIKMKHTLNFDEIDSKDITKIFYLLINKKIITEKNIFKNNKTIKLIYIENMNYINIKEVYKTNFKCFEYNNELWLYNETFWSLKKIFKENLKSGEKFELGDKNIINNLCNNFFYIDLENLENIYNIFLEENKIIKINIKDDYKKLINEYSENIFNKNKASIISKKISLYLKCFIFENIIKNYEKNIKYYIPFIIDFRGRKYDLTDISPTFFSELRYCLYLGNYDFEKDIKQHSLNEKINNILIKYVYLLENDLRSENKIKNLSFIWLLISLAEPFKNKLGSIVSIKDFIKKGLEILNNKKIIENLDYDDKIKCIYILKIIEEIKKNIWIKRLIPKDATASVFQHLVKCLGKYNEDSLKYCNMNSEEYWYDTYSIIIEKFNIKIKKNDLSQEKYDKIFNRKNLKKIMMTRNYGCGLKKSFKYFNESIKDITKDYNKIEINEINNIFIKFYKYISENNEINKGDNNIIINFFKKNKSIIFQDLSKTNYKYFKFKEKRIDSTVDNKRYTRIIKKITNIEDIKKYKISIVANYIQSQDACLVRWVLNRITIITIHDCFMIDYVNISYLIALINEGMNVNFHSISKENDYNEIFSIFIVI